MKAYICKNFIGLYPVGTAAVVVAPNRARALVLLELSLEDANLPQPREHSLELQEITLDHEYAEILLNGDY